MPSPAEDATLRRALLTARSLALCCALSGCAETPQYSIPPILEPLYAKPSPFESIPRAQWIAESRNAYVIRDMAPKAPVHLLVIPKKRVPTLMQASPQLLGEMLDLAKKAAVQEGIADSGFRTIVNTHPDSRQSVYHLHIHVLGGRKMDWTDGFTEGEAARVQPGM